MISRLLGTLVITAIVASCSQTSTSKQVESEKQRAENFVDVTQFIPDANFDIRYFTDNNFVGEPITGYLAPKCIIHQKAAQALKAVNEALQKQNHRLKIFDCYRPQKAVDHFMRWVADTNDTKTKSDYYPNLDKALLKGDYIAEHSGHTRGYTVDLTIEKKLPDGRYKELDMGSPFDLFDAKSNTDSPQVNAKQLKNRHKLRDIMLKNGFTDYSMEWWHFTHRTDPRDTYHDFNVE